MGFDAIWISPVTAQIKSEGSGTSAYHGYWQQDLYAIEPHFGTAEELVELSQALHDRDMVMQITLLA
jgi:alpha-amylase